MCCYDTEENGRSEYTHQTLDSLWSTVDFTKQKLVMVDNGSCDITKRLLKKANEREGHILVTLSENIGTARGINRGLRMRKPGENCIKIDNDVVITQSGWVKEMEEVLRRDASIGIVGLKRKDLAEWPLETGWAHSSLMPLPHVPGERWVIVEQVNHVMGTCQILSSALIDKIGGFYQGDGNLYGFDDSLLSLRSSLAGFKNVFLPHIDIDHIDTGVGEYNAWKHRHASEKIVEYNNICEEYKNGTRDLYYEI